MKKKAMGHIWAEISLGNPRDIEIEPLSVRALADTGALMLCIPEHLAIQLKLDLEVTREATLADGTHKNVPYAGPIKVNFGKRNCYVGALVLGNEVLLGAGPI